MFATAFPNFTSHAEAVYESLNDHATMCGFQGDEADAAQFDPHLDALDTLISLTQDVQTTEDIFQKFDMGLPADAFLTKRQELLIDLTFLSAKIVMANETAAIASVLGDFYEDGGMPPIAQALRDELAAAEPVRQRLSREARDAGASLRDILNATTGNPEMIATSL